MKKRFNIPELIIIQFTDEDIITTSVDEMGTNGALSEGDTDILIFPKFE